MAFNRSSGILLHPTSFPGPYGIGDLGPEAFSFIDFLSRSGSKLWQVLPLGPTGYGDSPYQCFSAFAGNPYLVSPEKLIDLGLLKTTDMVDMPTWDPEKIDFGEIYKWKPALLQKSFAHFNEFGGLHPLKIDFMDFCIENKDWLDEYSLFMTIKEYHGGNSWTEWDESFRDRNREVLQKFSATHQKTILEFKFTQFLFFKQWLELKTYANSKGIQIIGDIPIFVAMDSSDTWGAPELFYLDKNGYPTVVAGVPPDYFSNTGQLWGNPLYNWQIHENSGFSWWIKRIRACVKIFDIVRIDHFRGFAGYWEIPYGESTAIKGRWVPGPGPRLFYAIKDALGELPIIAEDLGEITPDVIELRDMFQLPGMKILQFGFSGPDNPFLPHLYPNNCIAYTGTHDNDTAIGWLKTAPSHERSYYQDYMGRTGENAAEEMIRKIWESVAMFAIAPLQDLLGLDTEARMNFPGKVGGYWSWRMKPGILDQRMAERLRHLNWLYLR